jgi:hypothetical protein
MERMKQVNVDFLRVQIDCDSASITLNLKNRWWNILPYSSVANNYYEDMRHGLKYLKSETDSLLAGLAEAVEKPEEFFTQFSVKSSEDNNPGFVTISAYMNEEEKSKFKAYPYEMTVVFMAEKIGLPKIKECVSNIICQLNQLRETWSLVEERERVKKRPMF